MKTFIVTGATQGLGLAIVKQLSRNKDYKVIMAVRNVNKGQELAKSFGSNVKVVKLDLASLGDVVDFVNNWDTKLDGLINNAGVQFNQDDHFSKDGYEETIAVNHLGAFLLTYGLMKWFNADCKVVFIGSGTHNPELGSFGFRGSQYYRTDIKRLAAGEPIEPKDDGPQRNKDRYSTSKYLNTVIPRELVKRYPNLTVYSLDPGLMGDTELFREQSRIYRLLLQKILIPLVGVFNSMISTTKKSADAACWIVTSDSIPINNGESVYCTKVANDNIDWKSVHNEHECARAYDETVEFLDDYIKKFK
ncbi:unnamed protein product [[Candida] boidinii]|uniref:Unnamed protein product n=1 Tax=Candida boidinii TaxID=5477 RepID=A0A9W6SV09_CANBO|nr:unnamed protein product [[Candida] boidinii]GMG07494.1 unnamed protein product [[Candida] boidinii]